MTEVSALLPEIFLALTLVAVIIGEITYHGEQLRLIVPMALIGLAITLIQTVIAFKMPAAQIFSRTIVIDGISLFFKILFLVLAGLSIVGSTHTREIPEDRRAEFCALIVASTLAMGIVAASAD